MLPRIDIDRYQEILDTITRNKSRSLLTGFGVFWGIFMLVTLMGGGEGLKEILQKNFSGFATNSGFIWAQPTTKVHKGFRKGRVWTLNNHDVERILLLVPGVDVVSPQLTMWGQTAVKDEQKSSCIVDGLRPDMQKVSEPLLRYGRYLNDMDLLQRRKVCIIGKKVYKNLFPGGGNPCGEYIKVGNIYYQIVGVDYQTSNVSINGSSEEKVTIPLTVYQSVFHKGDQVEEICFTAKPGVTVSSITPKIRQVIGRAHYVSPDDEKSIMVFNTEVMFGMLDNLFNGVNFLILLVGIGTVLAGAIGVSNIMMVTVRERTTEIGIRRAIGATPRTILGQIISESIILTAVAGMSGILLGVMVLQMLELGNTEDGILAAHFQIGFWPALLAVVLLTVLGVLAGLAPALRAMSIKPVDAMREN